MDTRNDREIDRDSQAASALPARGRGTGCRTVRPTASTRLTCEKSSVGPWSVSSTSNSGFDREQADRPVVGLHRPVEGGFACFALLDMNRLLTISGLEAILKTPSWSIGRSRRARGARPVRRVTMLGHHFIERSRVQAPRRGVFDAQGAWGIEGRSDRRGWVEKIGDASSGANESLVGMWPVDCRAILPATRTRRAGEQRWQGYSSRMGMPSLPACSNDWARSTSR